MTKQRSKIKMTQKKCCTFLTLNGNKIAIIELNETGLCVCIYITISHLLKGSCNSASVFPLSGILLSILINLKGPFPLLQEQQLIKWLISDGRVWMFWVNFIDLPAGPGGPERKPATHLRVFWPGKGGQCRFTPLSFIDTFKTQKVRRPTLSANAGRKQLWSCHQLSPEEPQKTYFITNLH